MARKSKTTKIAEQINNKIETLTPTSELITEVGYQGMASFNLKFNGKPVSVQLHNSGTPNLQRAFAMMASGNFDNLYYYVPKYLDVTNEEGTFSYLSYKIALSGSSMERLKGTWVAQHKATIDVANVLAPAPQGSKCKLQLLNGDQSMVIAEITALADETLNLVAGNVSGLVTWIMKLNV